MNPLIGLFIAILIFFAGVASGAFYFRNHTITAAPQTSSLCKENTDHPGIHNPISPTPKINLPQNKTYVVAPLQSQPIAQSAGERKSLDSTTARWHELSKLLEIPFPNDVPMIQKSNPDGSTDETGSSPDGKYFSRHFTRRGELREESWDDPSIGTLVRTYYASGAIRHVSWVRPRVGSRPLANSTISYTESGEIESRYDAFEDGTYLFTDYDDRGQPKNSRAGP